MKVSVILPTIRPDKARPCVDRLFESTRGHDVECIAVVERSPETRAALLGSGAKVIYRDTKHGAVYCWNEGSLAATGDAFVLGADDLYWRDGWLDEALNVLETLPDQSGQVGLNDGSKHEFYTHYLMTREHVMQHMGGCFVTPHYRHYFIDPEAYVRSARVGRAAYAEKSLVTHVNPLYGYDVPLDAPYRVAQRSYGDDYAMHLWRAEENFPDDFPPWLGVNPTPCVFWVLLCPTHEITNRRSRTITEYCYERGYYRIDQPQGRTDLTRNRIERRFRRLSVRPDDVLVMLDGDHDHPYHIVETLAIQDVPVLGALYRIRGSAEVAMFLMGEDKELHHVNKWAEGQIVKVDAVGTGAIAIKRYVFEQLEAAGVRPPFFRYHYKGDDEYQPSEDIYFTLACSQSGIDVGCHTGIYTNHIVNAMI